MNNIKNDDLIEKFFDNDLSPLEQKIFDRKVRKDPDFAEALAFREELEAYFQYETKVKRLDRTMERVEKELELKDKAKVINWYKRFSVAAGVITLGIFCTRKGNMMRLLLYWRRLWNVGLDILENYMKRSCEVIIF